MVKAAELNRTAFAIPGQLGPRASRLLLWLQRSVAQALGEYRYLEIGSFRGRSLLPHILCDECVGAVSIDLRPPLAADTRGAFSGYDRVTAEDMVATIARHAPGVDVRAKLRAVTATSDWIAAARPADRFDLAFIDGEHTNEAAFRDFTNVMRVMRDNAVVAFDDTPLVLPAVVNATALLDMLDIPWRLHHTVCGISIFALGDFSETLAPPPRLLATRREMQARRDAVLARTEARATVVAVA